MDLCPFQTIYQDYCRIIYTLLLATFFWEPLLTYSEWFPESRKPELQTIFPCNIILSKASWVVHTSPNNGLQLQSQWDIDTRRSCRWKAKSHEMWRCLRQESAFSEVHAAAEWAIRIVCPRTGTQGPAWAPSAITQLHITAALWEVNPRVYDGKKIQ